MMIDNLKELRREDTAAAVSQVLSQNAPILMHDMRI